MQQLAETLEDIDWGSAAIEPKNTFCADCFVYDIVYEGRRVSTTGLGSSGRELSDLLSLVDALISGS